MIKGLKNYWVIVDNAGVPVFQTISGYKKQSVDLFIESLMCSWLSLTKEGYRCVKVNIQFTEVK